MLSSVDKGEYQLYQYTKVFHFATRFNNILKFDFVNLKKRIFRGIKKGIPSYAYIFDLDFKLSVSNDIEFRDEILKIIKYCVEVNELIRVKNEHNKLNELFWLFNNDIKAFLDKVQLRDNEFSFIPMWNRFNFKEFMTTLKNIDNTEIWRLSRYFKTRYSGNIYKELYPEKEFVIKLREELNKPTKQRNINNLRNACLDFLSKCLAESEQNFPV
jgi:hypothetical protein